MLPLCDLDGWSFGHVTDEKVHQNVIAISKLVHQVSRLGSQPFSVQVVVVAVVEGQTYVVLKVKLRLITTRLRLDHFLSFQKNSNSIQKCQFFSKIKSAIKSVISQPWEEDMMKRQKIKFFLPVRTIEYSFDHFEV